MRIPPQPLISVKSGLAPTEAEIETPDLGFTAFASHPRAGFALPAVLFIASALLILAVGMLLVVGIERSTARAYCDHQRAELAVRAGLEDVKGSLSLETSNDKFIVLQAALKQAIKPGREPAPMLFFAHGSNASGESLSFRYVPLFSTTNRPEATTRLSAPQIEPLVSAKPADALDLATLPYLDPVRITWLPILDERHQIVARYAFWLEDLQGKLNPQTAGNTDGPNGTHAGSAWPFPAPALNPCAAAPEHPALDRLALHAIDPASTAEQPGTLARTLLSNRSVMVSPDSLLAAAAIQPPLTRDATGHLTDPAARAVEENLTTTVRPYLEQPHVPFVAGIVVADHVGLTENEGAAGVSLLWNGQQVDRAAGIIRQKKGLEFDLSKPRYASKATVGALALGAYGSEIDNPGDPRVSYYLRSTPLAENANPENSSPNRRNIRRGTIYESDSARKPKTYGRVQPSEWPDGGHDSAVGTWPISTDDAVCPTDPRYNWAQNPIAAQAPQRLSNAGRFYSATELGRIYDPLMWQPTFDNPQDTASIRNGLMPAARFAWPDVMPGSPASPDHGGGNSLRIGRPEHPAFDQPGKRAIHLLDLFHAGRSRSAQPALREGNLVEIQGHVNLNTATAGALRALAAGALGQDPLLASVPNTLSHQGAPLMAPPPTPITLFAPSNEHKTEAERLAAAIIRARPFASPSEVALVRDSDGKPVFGNPDRYRPGIDLPNNTRVQWSDSAAEEVFARVYEASTVRSRNFRVWVIGQAIAPAASTTAAPQVLAEVRKVFTLFADPGERSSEGAIDPAKSQPVVIHENDF